MIAFETWAYGDVMLEKGHIPSMRPKTPKSQDYRLKQTSGHTGGGSRAYCSECTKSLCMSLVVLGLSLISYIVSIPLPAKFSRNLARCMGLFLLDSWRRYGHFTYQITSEHKERLCFLVMTCAIPCTSIVMEPAMLPKPCVQEPQFWALSALL